MKARDRHIPLDQLTALALVARAPEGASAEAADQVALAHVATCDRCSSQFSRLTADADALRDVAFAQADEVFDDAMLDAQRTRILDRLAHLGQAARVLSFPRRSRDVVMPVASGSRRWVSVAAAAGLIIGLVAGQLLHFVPSRGTVGIRDQVMTMQAPDRPGGPVLVPASASVPALSDDDLMEEVEASVQSRRAQSLRALDALTPTAADMLAVR
jgi:hypothetical protein